MNPYKYSMDLSSYFEEKQEEKALPETGIMKRNVSRAAATEEPEQEAYDPYGFLGDFSKKFKMAFADEGTALNFLGKKEGARPEAERTSEVQSYIKTLTQRNAIEDTLASLNLPEYPQDMPSPGTLGPLEGTQTLPSAPPVSTSPLGPKLDTPELKIDPINIPGEDSGIDSYSPPSDLEAFDSFLDSVFSMSEEDKTTPEQPKEQLKGKGLMSKEQDAEEVKVESTSSNALLDFIGEGEGTYDSANRGTDSKGNIIGSQLTAERGGKKISELTIGEIREYQSIKDPNNDDRLFTVGKYQTIPGTFEEAVKGLGLSDDTVFSPEVQDQVGMYLVSKKRPRLGKFLKGDDSVSTDQAMLELAKEFASAPVPFAIKKGAYGSWPKTDLVAGDSFYKDPRAASGNRASHSLDKTRKMLNSVRGMLK